MVRNVELSHGRIPVRDEGSGRPLLFVHGLLVNGLLWSDVTSELTSGYRCIVPDLPFGAHREPARPDADLSPARLAGLLVDLCDALDLREPILVGNDTGGALCQLAVAARPDRFGGLVLTSCDAYDVFPPKMFAYLKVAARIPGALAIGLQPMRIRALRRLPLAFGWLAKRRIPDAITDAWVLPVLTNPDVRRDVRRLLSSLRGDELVDIGPRLGRFEKPVLIAWGAEDRFFPPAYGERLARDFPRGRYLAIPGARTFVPLDQPARLVEVMRSFLEESQPAAGLHSVAG